MKSKKSKGFDPLEGLRSKSLKGEVHSQSSPAPSMAKKGGESIEESGNLDRFEGNIWEEKQGAEYFDGMQFIADNAKTNVTPEDCPAAWVFNRLNLIQRDVEAEKAFWIAWDRLGNNKQKVDDAWDDENCEPTKAIDHLLKLQAG